MTNCDGRCRSGRAFGQGFNSPQVHIFLPFIWVKVRQHVIFLKVSGAFFLLFYAPVAIDSHESIINIQKASRGFYG